MLSTKATRLLPSVSEKDSSGDCEEPKAVHLENDRAVIAMSALRTVGKRESNRREQGFLSLVVECHWRQHRMGYAGKEMKGV